MLRSLMFYRVNFSDSIACAEGAPDCGETTEVIRKDNDKAAVFSYKELLPTASPRDSLLDYATSSGAVAQWLELGTHNP